MPRKMYTRECKRKVVRTIESGELRLAQACCEYHIAERILNRWRYEVRLRGDDAFTPLDGPTAVPDDEQRSAALERVCGHLAVAHAALQKAVQRAQPKRGTA